MLYTTAITKIKRLDPSICEEGKSLIIILVLPNLGACYDHGVYIQPRHKHLPFCWDSSREEC